WEEFIRELVYEKEFKKLGIVCTKEELYDQMLVHPHSIVVSQFRDQQTQQIAKEFANPDGSLNVRELNKLVSQFKPEQDEMWGNLETYVQQSRLMEKYSALIKGGLYTTSVEAKMNYAVQATSYDVRFVLKKYTDIPDANVKVTEEDIQTYYNEHLYEFQNDIPSRSIEYVTWDVVPSKADIDTLNNELSRIAAEFRKTAADEDAAFTVAENDGRADTTSSLKEKMSPSIPDSFYTSPAGTVYGPYNENRTYKVIKIRGTEQINDSAKVRHILISVPNERNPNIKRSVAQSKSLADSLTALLKKDRKRFDEFVEKYSDDPGKTKPNIKQNPQVLMNTQVFPNPKDTNNYTGKGGNYGWMKESSRFVESFKDYGMKGKKGDIGVVPSEFGFHIMEVLEVSKTTKTKYKIATISRELKPSDITRQDFMQKASDFAGQNNTAEKFQKAVEAQKLNKRLHEDLKENDPFIPGFQNPGESPKEMIRDVYKGKAGDVIPPRIIGERIIVVLITKTRERGPSELEFVKDDITNKVRDQKKAEIIINDFK
ncbi:MAG: peptidylprolyl isomerase, partial [Bacteroidia bacterium]|nr:peptidylprolyl isomerase [Bacteroidia bacterium]